MHKIPAAALLTACLLLNAACLRVRTTPDFRPQTAATPTAQRLPARLDGIRVENRADLSTITGRDDWITGPLHNALRDSLVQSRLFDDAAAQGVSLTAVILSFEANSGVSHKSRIRIRYEFADSGSGKIRYAAEIDSTAREFSISPIDMGQSADDAVQQAGRRNVAKLLHRLQTEAARAAFAAP